METLGQYVPQIVQEVGELQGLQLLIPRVHLNFVKSLSFLPLHLCTSAPLHLCTSAPLHLCTSICKYEMHPIPRILGSVAGHMAYSGYLGYFIGLSVLKPKQSWLILAVGYLCASGLHALWNSTVVLRYHVLAIVGILSYAFLGAAILRDRSPRRDRQILPRN